MATDKQIAANRRNGALSRGPKTAAGKARSSRNALKHGLAVPITRDRATARKIRRAARQLSPSAEGDAIRNAQMATEAIFELARSMPSLGLSQRLSVSSKFLRYSHRCGFLVHLLSLVDPGRSRK